MCVQPIQIMLLKPNNLTPEILSYENKSYPYYCSDNAVYFISWNGFFRM